MFRVNENNVKISFTITTTGPHYIQYFLMKENMNVAHSYSPSTWIIFLILNKKEAHDSPCSLKFSFKLIFTLKRISDCKNKSCKNLTGLWMENRFSFDLLGSYMLCQAYIIIYSFILIYNIYNNVFCSQSILGKYNIYLLIKRTSHLRTYWEQSLLNLSSRHEAELQE